LVTAYVAGDLPERFAQHNGLPGCPAAGRTREQPGNR